MTRKLKLELDDLAVETFATAGEEEARGTVRGHCSEFGTCDSCAGSCNLPSCDVVEQGTCGPFTCGNVQCAFEFETDCMSNCC